MKYSLIVFVGLICVAGKLTAAELLGRNVEVPFAYLPGGERSWQLTDQPLGAGERLTHAATLPDGFDVQLHRSGRLVVKASAGLRETLDLEVQLDRPDGTPAQQKQTLKLLPAPADRPLTYLSDQLDDLIRIFRDPGTGKWKPVTRAAFDPYFRRLQAHGVRRLIVWPSAFPTLSDPENYGAENWSRFEKQARAILESEELNRVLYDDRGFVPYEWHGLLMRFRLNPAWGRMYAQSAADHGIALTVSYRPFEHALMKYYVIPVFDTQGRFLWNFLPGANPKVNFEPQDVAFAHYREILKAGGQQAHAELQSVTFAAVPESMPQAIDRKHLRVYAAQVPPIARNSFVLVRDQSGRFQVTRFEKIAEQVEAQRVELQDWTLHVQDDGAIQLSNLKRPDDHRYLIVGRGDAEAQALHLPVELPVSARSQAGSPIGRINAHWALAETDLDQATTRLGGITATGSYRTDFQAIENSFRLVRRSGKPLRPLGEDEIVIDFGSDWSPEMMDYNRPAARQLAIREIRTMLAAPTFDEIVVNTRSHTQLAGSRGDGELGVQTIAHHRRRGKNYFHLGIDRAYAPRSVGQNPAIQTLLQDASNPNIAKITDWQTGEWMGTCQTQSTEYPWRYARNAAVAQGVRLLLQDLENEFSETRIRVMIPPRAAVENGVKRALEKMDHPQGGKYDAQYYRFLCSGLNQIPAIGEGMSMLDLDGLRAEPMLLGLRELPDDGPISLFVDAYVKNQADNHQSSHPGPKSFFYEAQYTLRQKDQAAAAARRQQIIRNLLARPEIKEVILYESANWIYDLPVDNPHRYLEP
ncbi:MAG TPA: hypothetical protein DCY79_19610 [Planctomycetaceae bacterium]|nr:hypothetical protein [Planctomycetaceae bacterium]